MKTAVSRSILLSCALAAIALAQIRPTTFAGQYPAVNFAYGSGGLAPLTISTGITAAGAGTITLNFGNMGTNDGMAVMPLATNAPILVGIGANAETVTPTAVSCYSPLVYNSCTVTATFTNAHGVGDLVASGTYGLQEAINYVRATGGGYVVLEAKWTALGGTNAMVAAATAYSSVEIDDNRPSAQAEYYTMQPTTLTALAVPATLTGTTVVFTAAPVGTWAASAYYFCVTYVDPLGGEGPCSLTYTQTPTLNYTANITSPPASTGAVGWRAYAGTGSLATAYLLPITSANCTLTTLEAVFPACAIGANGQWATAPTTTTSLKPNTQVTPTVNVSQTFAQSHTTFGYVPTNVLPAGFQTNYGPFVAYGALTAGQIAVLGSVQLPTGFLNVIGRTIRVTGKIALTTVNTATLPYITIGINWAGGLTAGAQVPICSLVPAAAGATSTQNETFSCTMTTNAVGTTAIGSIMTNGWENLVAAAGGALLGSTIDTGTAAIGSVGLFAQDTLNVVYTSTTNVTAGEQLLALNIEILQ